jgi:hypothetical protein
VYDEDVAGTEDKELDKKADIKVLYSVPFGR